MSSRSCQIHLIVALLGVVVMGLGGCAQSVTVPEFRGVTRVDVRTNMNEPLKEITDADQVARIVAFANEQRSGWETPWYGVPVPMIVAGFYDGSTVKGRLGVGKRFLETRYGSRLFSKGITEETERRYLGLLGLEPADLSRPRRSP